MPKTHTFYAVKWFVRREPVEDRLVGVMDDSHPISYLTAGLKSDDPEEQQAALSRLVRQYRNSAVLGDLGGIIANFKPITRRVKTGGEPVLSGLYQSSFQAYPEPLVKTRDPKLVGRQTPATCSSGWHVPFLTDVESFAPGEQSGGTPELWLVKVSGKHSLNTRYADSKKVAFEFIELRKQLNIGEVLKLTRYIAKAAANPGPGKWEAPYPGSYYEQYVRSDEENLIWFLRELDRVGKPSPNGYKARIGSAKLALLNPFSINGAEAGTVWNPSAQRKTRTRTPSERDAAVAAAGRSI